MPIRGSYPPGFLKTGRVEMPTRCADAPPSPSRPATERLKGDKRSYVRRKTEFQPHRVLATAIVGPSSEVATVSHHVITRKDTCPCCEGLGYLERKDTEVLECDGFMCDGVSIFYRGNRLDGFSQKMVKYMSALMSAHGQVVTKQGLFGFTNGDESDADSKIVDVYVCKLRRAIFNATELQPIQTVWGRGYTWQLPEQA